MFMFKKLLSTSRRSDEALPGRPTPIPTAKPAFRQRQPAEGPLSGGARDRDVRHGLLLGRRAQVLGAGRRHLRHRGRLCRRATRPTRPTRRSAPAAPATTRWCWWSSTRRRSPTRSCSRRSGKTTTRPRACARATTSARSTAPASTRRRRRRRRPPRSPRRCSSKALDGQALRRDHHRNPRRAGVLFRRGLSPAISGEESDGLLRARRHRRVVPDRHRRRSRRALSANPEMCCEGRIRGPLCF